MSEYSTTDRLTTPTIRLDRFPPANADERYAQSPPVPRDTAPLMPILIAGIVALLLMPWIGEWSLVLIGVFAVISTYIRRYATMSTRIYMMRGPLGLIARWYGDPVFDETQD